MRSIRGSLIVGTVAAMIAVIVVAGVVLNRSVRSRLLQQFDAALTDKAGVLASLVEVEGDNVELDYEDIDMSEFDSGEAPAYLQLWMHDGTLLYRSPSLGERDLTWRDGTREAPALHSFRMPDGRRVRAVSFAFHPRVEDEDDDEEGDAGEADRRMRMVFARGTETVDTFLAGLRNLLLGLGLLTVLVAGVVLTIVIRTNLRPLNQLATRISELDERRLSSRVALDHVPLELAPVVARLNEMLDGLERAFNREKQFSADIAHELRTPLAGMRSAIEVAVSRPRRPEDYKETLAELLDIVRKTQKMVQTMLYLCRLDAGQIETEEHPVAVEDLIRASWRPLEGLARARGLDVTWGVRKGVTVTTDPILLEVAIRNVLENAVVHADEGGRVRIETNGARNPTGIRVVNSGSKVPQERVPELLERFSRVDSARDPTKAHCGLGLSIVTQIAQILDLQIDIHSSVDGNFDVTLSVHNGAA